MIYIPINLSSNISMNTNLPIDSRFVFPDLVSRDNLNMSFRYIGLKSYVVSESRFYSLNSDLETWTADVNTTDLNTKVDKITGYSLSENDFSNQYKSDIDNLSTVATSGLYSDLIETPQIPNKISQLTNDTNFAIDSNYIHTDNNFTSLEKNKLDNLATVASSGNYNDLQNLPTISNGDVNSVNNQTADTSGNVVLTTANINDSVDKRYITDTEKSIINAISGINTGDETQSSIESKLGTASSTTNGYLTESDWNTFNNKQTDLGFIPENIINKDIANGYAGLDVNKKLIEMPTASDVGADASGTATNAVYIHNNDVNAHSALFENKVDKVNGKGLSTVDFTDTNYVHTDNNYTTTEKDKLAGIANGAEVNVNADWNATSGESQILNKPTSTATEIDTAVSEAHTHTNKNVLDELSDNSGFLNYDGNPIGVQPDWNENDNSKLDYIKNKPNLATVATSGSYNDLINKPTIVAINDSGTTGDITDTYSVNQIITLLATKQASIVISSITPSSPTTNLIWIDTTPPYTLQIYNGSWITVGGTQINFWTSGTNYIVGTLIIYSNALYICSSTNSNTTWNPNNWTLIGASSSAPIFPDWISGGNYIQFQIIAYNSFLYRLNRDAPNSTISPTADTSSYWFTLLDNYSYKANTSDVNSALALKADKVIGSTVGDIATLDVNGNLVDSGSSVSTINSNISTLQTNSGRIQINSSDTFDYIGNKIDGTTIQILTNKIVATTLNGLTATITELNYVHGAASSLQSQINALGAAFQLKGSIATHALLIAISSPSVGAAYIVNSDESQSGSPQDWYVYTSSGWVLMGVTSITVRNFTSNPINLTSEVTGILPQANMNLVGIATTANLATKTQINDSETSSSVDTFSITKLMSLFNAKQNKITFATTDPTSPSIYDLWGNTTTDPAILNFYNGSIWKQIGGNSGTISNWIASTSYSIGQLVIYNAQIYQTKIANSDSVFNSLNWINLSSNASITFAGDIAGTNTSQTVAKIQGIPISTASMTNGQVLAYNSTSGQIQATNVNISGIVGSTQITQSGSDITIAPATEQIFNYTSSSKILANIYEVIPSSTVNDTTVAFDSASKYNQQNSTYTSIGTGIAQLVNGGIDTYAKLMFHFDGTNGSAIITDSELTPKTITNNNVTINTSYSEFGGASGYFNGTSSALSIPHSSDFDFGSNNFTVDLWINPVSVSGKYYVLFTNRASSSPTYGLVLWLYNGNVQISFSSNNSTWVWQAATIISGVPYGTWSHVEIDRNGSNWYGFLNGVLSNTLTSASSIATSTYPLRIGGETDSDWFNGYIDEYRISNGISRHTANFTPANIAYYAYLNNVPSYISTIGASDYSLSTISQINSLTIPVTTPTNTSIFILCSFDNRNNWLYHNGTGWHIYSGNLTSVWTSSNLNTDLQTYFTNLTITQLTSDLSSLGVVPVSLDFMWQLYTTTNSATPSISALTCNYTTNSHLEGASVGSYSDSLSRYGLKIIGNTSLSVKNKDTISHTVRVYTVVSS